MRYRKSTTDAVLLRKCKSKFLWPFSGLRIFPKNFSKTLIFLKLRGGGKFIPWFFDVLGPTHHLITKLKNRYIFLSIFNLDFLLTFVSCVEALLISNFLQIFAKYSKILQINYTETTVIIIHVFDNFEAKTTRIVRSVFMK